MKRKLSFLLILALLLSCVPLMPVTTANAAAGAVTTTTIPSSNLLDDLMEQYTSFIVVKHKQLGGSHYAYTEAVSDTFNTTSPDGEETDLFRPGSQMVLVELRKNGNSVTETETVLLESNDGVIRDPDVSEDGTRVIFSWKKSQAGDDYHLYEYDLITKQTRQLTYGMGVADTEPKYLPNGNIVFSSTRTVQTVDCWKTPVSNLFVCGPDGENIVRLGYDQVHTTYPTVTSDGRVLYTRWDYNDRSQMYVQGVFQMFPDGTNQTEVFGNNANFPTTLLHTREIPGLSDQYISIATGHHTWQAGKLVILDTSKGRNNPDAVTLVFPDGQHDKGRSIDKYGQNGPLYKYPYAFSENQFLVSYAPNGWISNKASTPFSIYVMDTAGNKVELVKGTEAYPASQIVPVATRTLFERASMVNYASSTGTYYIGNIYEGDGLKGVPVGTAKYLRIVALDYRAYSIGQTASSGTGTGDPFSPISIGNGSWDVKRVLGIVPIEEDGSALFKVPSETPIYFQVLDENGEAIQSMRSWSTLMPGETFSCVGCHEDKNMVPPASSTTTLAMKKGVQEIQPDFWQTGEGYEDYDPYTDSKGFSYLEEIQPIWDESCVQCHNDQDAAFTYINAQEMAGADVSLPDQPVTGETVNVIPTGSDWRYMMSGDINAVPADWSANGFNDSAWATGKAPFGDRKDNGINYATNWSGNNKYIWIRKTFNITNVEEFRSAIVQLNTYYDDNPEFYINGHKFYEPENWVDNYTDVKLSGTKSEDMTRWLVEGTNVLAIRCENGTGGRMIDTALSFIKVEKKTKEIFPTKASGWQYVINAKPADNWTSVDFNASSWATGTAGFGHDLNIANTKWGAMSQQSEIWLRKEFTLTASDLAEMKDLCLVLDIMYDQDPVIYLNGTKILSLDGWYDTSYIYKTPNLNSIELLQEGKNVLAIYAHNVSGGCYIDTGLRATEIMGSAFSLESRAMGSNGMKKEWPLSYLYLTASKPNAQEEWVGAPSNSLINWISCMSQCEMLTPYQYGSTKSKLVEILEENHNGVTLTDVQMRKIRAWIDLAVPCYADYESGGVWDDNARRWADEFQNKRDYYETMNDLSRAARTGAGYQEVGISYRSGSTVYDDTYAFGTATRLEVPAKYKGGDTITITLPKGETYLGLTLDSLMGETILYVPSGTFTYTVPSDQQPYTRTFTNGNNKTITARVADSSELNGRVNLAENPYDLTDLNGNMAVTAYPHATTDSNYGNSGQFVVRNAIDGFTANLGHGSYPSQSWGPDQGSGHWMQIDFGREVSMAEVVLTIRANFPHDTYFESGTLEFYDLNGGKVNSVDITIEKTAEPQSFAFEEVQAASVRLTNLKTVDVSGDDWASISEFAVYGVPGQTDEEDFCIWDRYDDRQIISGMAAGTTIDQFKAGFGSEVTVYDGSEEVTSGTVATGMTVQYGGINYQLGVMGDLNGDGDISVMDLIQLKNLILREQWSDLELFVGNLDGDDTLMASDIMALKCVLIPSN